jgi:hypothetical protein
MSGNERTGRRDLLYSRWHRTNSTSRFIGGVRASHLEMIDLDDVESCPTCHRTVALIETKNSSSDPVSFPVYITANLAADASRPAFCVCYTCVCGVTGDKHQTCDSCDIAEFRVQQIAPDLGDLLHMTPRAFAYWLHAFRVQHWRDHCATPLIR